MEFVTIDFETTGYENGDLCDAVACANLANFLSL